MSSTQQKITDWLRKYKGPRPSIITTEILWMMINLWEHLELLSVNKTQSDVAPENNPYIAAANALMGKQPTPIDQSSAWTDDKMFKAQQTDADTIKDLKTNLWREENISRNACQMSKEHYNNSTRLVEEKRHLHTRLKIATIALDQITNLSFQEAEGGYRAENISHVALDEIEKES